MEKLVLYIYGLEKDFALGIKNDSQVAFDNYLELLSIFLEKKDEKFILGTPIQMNSNMRKKYQEYINKYKRESPLLNRFKKSLDKIKDNEFFWIDLKDSHTAEEILFIGNLVKVYNDSNDDEERAKAFENSYKVENEFFGELLEKYEVSVFDTSNKKSIGESDRVKRVCRFCKKNMADGVTFRKKAHAISEALGNKQLVLNEECDTCNDSFGSKIENDFIQYLDIFRVFFQVKGKKGVPTIKYKDKAIIKSISKDELPANDLVQDANLMVVVSKDITHNKDTGSLSVLLESEQEIKEVNIYKALCKYVLSVIDESELEYLDKTIEWISRDDNEHIELPNVVGTIINEMYVDCLVLSLYIRKNNDSCPHVVAEFRFKSLIFVFILPFSAKDEKLRIGKDGYTEVWKIFKHYNTIKTWNFYDFSSIESKKYAFRINVNPENKKD